MALYLFQIDNQIELTFGNRTNQMPLGIQRVPISTNTHQIPCTELQILNAHMTLMICNKLNVGY